MIPRSVGRSAIQQCGWLHKKGKKLALTNLRSLGFPIDRVISTPANPESASVKSVKADALAALKPIAFIDDYAPYLRGIPADVHAALVLREPNGSPNIGDDLLLAHSKHADLATFATWWLEPTKRGPTGLG